MQKMNNCIPTANCQLTKNFSLDELYKSNTAQRAGIDNTPTLDIVLKLKVLCISILQPIREKYGKPIVVTSGYRCTALNKLLKGAENSDHCFGVAADIRSLSDSRSENKVLFDLIKGMIDSKQIEVKQLIDEYDYDWIHISYQDGRSTKKNQILHLK